jgi:hypothetical protein
MLQNYLRAAADIRHAKRDLLSAAIILKQANPGFMSQIIEYLEYNADNLEKTAEMIQNYKPPTLTSNERD